MKGGLNVHHHLFTLSLGHRHGGTIFVCGYRARESKLKLMDKVTGVGFSLSKVWLDEVR